jgi:integrase
MNENMKDQKPIEASAKKLGKPWKTIKGPCREVAIYRWESGGRTFYRVLIPGGTPDSKTTSNKQTAIDLATAMSGVPLKLAATLAEVTPALLVKTAEAIQKLDPILKPLDMSIHAGLEEYAQLKARTGKLVLPGLFEGLLTTSGALMDSIALDVRLREISAAITNLVPVLGPLNISIASGIEEYAAVKTKAGSQDLRDLFKQLLSKVWVEKSKTPIATVAQAFLDAKKDEGNVSYEYYKTFYYTLGWVVKHVGASTPIGAVTTDQLKQVVFSKDRQPRSNQTYRTNIRTFFHWCQLHNYLDYVQPTAADLLEKICVKKEAPRILTVAEAKALFMALDDPWCLLYLVLSVFTAIRHDELQRATFDLIKPGLLEIPAKISKTKKRRIIPIQPALAEWLAPFHGRSGLILPIANAQYLVHEFLKESGLDNLPRKWSRNWLRQSFCSYRLAQTGKVMETAAEDGHSAYILESVYLHHSNSAEAETFFALSPEACGKKDWCEKTRAFLENVPEVHARRKFKTKAWKKIGGEPAVPEPMVLPDVAQTPLQQAA